MSGIMGKRLVKSDGESSDGDHSEEVINEAIVFRLGADIRLSYPVQISAAKLFA